MGSNKNRIGSKGAGMGQFHKKPGAYNAGGISKNPYGGAKGLSKAGANAMGGDPMGLYGGGSQGGPPGGGANPTSPLPDLSKYKSGGLGGGGLGGGLGGGMGGGGLGGYGRHS